MAAKVVVITGCSSGMGLDTAVFLANDKENRFKVFATMRNLAKKAQLEIAAGSTLDKTLFIRQLDVTKDDSIEDFMDKINREEGGVDVLVNNAGVGQAGPLENEKLDQIKTLFNTNVIGLIRLTQAVIPGMKAKRAGHIISVSSIGGLMGVPFSEVYVASKFAVEGFSEALAPLLRQFNVRVSVIEPGPVKTSILANMDVKKTGSSDDQDIDEETQKLFATTFGTFLQKAAKLMQTGTDIAKIIRDAILSEKPQLHYITSESFRKVYAEKKFIDITGDSIVEYIAKEQKWNE